MTGWRAWCPKRDAGCPWTIDALTEEAARRAGRRHYYTEHAPRPPAKVRRTSWPYRGKLNKSQARLLGMAASEELIGYQQAIYTPQRGDTIDLSDPSSTLGPPTIRWVPIRLRGNLDKWVRGLVDAGLLRDPKPADDQDQRGRRLPDSPYRLTPEGRRVLARSEARAG